MRAVAQPDGEADERVAERAQSERLYEAEAGLPASDRKRRLTDCAAAEGVLLAEVDEDHRAEGAHEVAGVDGCSSGGTPELTTIPPSSPTGICECSTRSTARTAVRRPAASVTFAQA